MSSYKQLSGILATATAGIVAGCLTFVSFVDTRSFLSHVKNKDSDLIKSHFAIWWPCGRDLMKPLLLSGVICNAIAYRTTRHVNFAATASLLACIGPYTAVVLGEDIESLRKSSCREVEETTYHFCKMHHLRLVAAGAGFGLSLLALSEM